MSPGMPVPAPDPAGRIPAHEWGLATIAVTAGRPDRPGEPFNVAPTFASTYRDGGEIGYGRWGNPTWTAFEAAIGALEDGRALAYSSGQAATAALLDTLPVGATVILPRDCYTGTRALCSALADIGRHRALLLDLTDTATVLDQLSRAALLWIESPLNPLLGVVDLPTVLSAAAAAGVPTVVDNTLATPVLQRPLALGATAVVHSATKFIGGHSDLLLGCVVTQDDALLGRLLERRTLHGAIPGTLETWLALRGLRTLPLRVERAQTTARVLAERLEESRDVVRVRYPGLRSHPGHQLAEEQMRGPGAILSFEVEDQAVAEAFTAHLRLVVGGTSLGGVETTIDRRSRWAGEQAIPPGLLRLSVGIEDPEDLWADLEQALRRSRGPASLAT
jgi:cystathionine gamma-synthase